MPFVSKANGNPVLAERPELLDKPVIKFTLTLAREKGLDGFAASHELGSVAPPAVYRVCERHAGRIARVPCIFGESGFLYRRFQRKGGVAENESFGLS